MKAGCLRAAPHTSIPPLHDAAERANLEGISLSSTEMIETTPQSAGASTATEEPDEHDGHEHSHSAATLNPDCTREVEIEIPADEVDELLPLIKQIMIDAGDQVLRHIIPVEVEDQVGPTWAKPARISAPRIGSRARPALRPSVAKR